MHGNAHEITEDYYGAMFSLTAAATREDPLNRCNAPFRPAELDKSGVRRTFTESAFKLPKVDSVKVRLFRVAFLRQWGRAEPGFDCQGDVGVFAQELRGLVSALADARLPERQPCPLLVNRAPFGAEVD